MWKPCTNCDGEGGWHDGDIGWSPCTKCDGVGGYWPTEGKTVTISSELVEMLDYLLENYNLTLEVIIDEAIREKYEETRAAYKSYFLQHIK